MTNRGSQWIGWIPGRAAAGHRLHKDRLTAHTRIPGSRWILGASRPVRPCSGSNVLRSHFLAARIGAGEENGESHSGAEIPGKAGRDASQIFLSRHGAQPSVAGGVLRSLPKFKPLHNHSGISRVSELDTSVYPCSHWRETLPRRLQVQYGVAAPE